MAPGLIAAIAALAVAATSGLAWQRTNGRMRGASPRGSGTAAVRPAGGQQPGVPQPAPEVAQPVLTAAQLGQPLGERATLVQFSSAFCAPCRATRRILADVAAMVDGVEHTEIDAEAHLDLVRALGIRRTPTVLVLGPDGRIVKRASGQPRKPDVIAALGAAVMPADAHWNSH
jgi:thiol-disulfide isomerase/thioredoxin